MTIEEFIKKYGTRTPGLMVHGAFNPTLPEKNRKELETATREMMDDLEGALIEFTQRSKQ